MARYIDVDCLKEEIIGARYIKNPQYLDTQEALHIIDMQPTADVAEVKHGKWIAVKENGPYVEFVTGYRCSCCSGDADWSENRDADVIYFTGDYCSNCGAIMDGRDIEDDL